MQPYLILHVRACLARALLVLPSTDEKSCMVCRRYEDNPEKDVKESAKTQTEGSEEVNGEAKKSQ